MNVICEQKKVPIRDSEWFRMLDVIFFSFVQLFNLVLSLSLCASSCKKDA